MCLCVCMLRCLLAIMSSEWFPFLWKAEWFLFNLIAMAKDRVVMFHHFPAYYANTNIRSNWMGNKCGSMCIFFCPLFNLLLLGGLCWMPSGSNVLVIGFEHLTHEYLNRTYFQCLGNRKLFLIPLTYGIISLKSDKSENWYPYIIPTTELNSSNYVKK